MVSWFMRSRIGGSRSAEEFRGGSGGGIIGSGSPGTGSRFSGSGFEGFGQSSGGFGSHLEDSASLWCWSCGIALSFLTENPRTCCFWCWRRKLLLDFLYVFCDVANQGIEFLEDQVHDGKSILI